jgi:hypothetical protein
LRAFREYTKSRKLIKKGRDENIVISTTLENNLEQKLFGDPEGEALKKEIKFGTL